MTVTSISIVHNPDTLFEGGNAQGVDRAATIDAYEEAVIDAVRECFPGANVEMSPPRSTARSSSITPARTNGTIRSSKRFSIVWRPCGNTAIFGCGPVTTMPTTTPPRLNHGRTNSTRMVATANTRHDHNNAGAINPGVIAWRKGTPASAGDGP